MYHQRVNNKGSLQWRILFSRGSGSVRVKFGGYSETHAIGVTCFFFAWWGDKLVASQFGIIGVDARVRRFTN